MAGKKAVRVQGYLMAMTFGVFAASPVWAEDNPGQALAALERKLDGVWVGNGPCDGQLTIKADGTYQRLRHGPGGNNSSGTWKVRWDALPPTLVLSCKTTDDAAYAGKTLEVKIVQLDDAELVFKYQKQIPARYTRGKKQRKPEERE